MSKKLLLNKFGKLFLMVGVIFAVSKIPNANAQVEIRCIREENRGGSHSHNFNQKYCGEYSVSYDKCSRWDWTEVDNFTVLPDNSLGFPASRYIFTLHTLPSSINIPVCVAWGLFINGQQVSNMDQLLQKIPSKDKGTFRTKVIESLNTMELQKIYDPNLLRN